MELTIPNVIDRQKRIFGRRNNIFFTSRDRRILFLIKGANELAKHYRSNPNNTDQLGGDLVRILSRIICVAEHYGDDIPLAQAFANKWLGDVCLYCGQTPCVCVSEQRPDPQSTVSNRADWNFSQIAQHLEMLYGTVNATRPIEYLILRLTEECGETSSAVIRSTRATDDPETILYEIAKELADGIAWVFTLANRIGVDIQAEYLLRYGNGCRSCGQPVCICTEFDFAIRAATTV